MDSNAIMQSIISAVAVVITGIVSGVASASSTKYRLKEIEKKVDKHNNLVERMYAAEAMCKENANNINDLVEDVRKINSL